MKRGLKSSVEKIGGRFLPHADRFSKFFLTGGLGFLVDASVFLILIHPLSISVYVARVLSFLVAVSITWYLNRTFTFVDRSDRNKAKSEYSRYFGVQVAGATLNYGIFVVSLTVLSGLRGAPLIALTIGSAVAMLFNYLGAHYVAFPRNERH